MSKYKFLLILLSLTVNIHAQVSASDLKKISNSQLDIIKNELQKIPSLPTSLDAPETITSNSPNDSKTITSNSSGGTKSPYFGYDYFKVDKSIFDNIPTPQNYTLGPGDKIIISLWGEINIREEFILNKEGLFYYPNIGFINISNKTIEKAEQILYQSFSKIYSTLVDKENSTSLRLELADLKSINVYFTGQFFNPGINIIHPFSDIFLAIIQAGGINDIGSLRNVQLIRKGELISTFDFYDFFVRGKNTFSDTRIFDGDVIHVPVISSRVKIDGAVQRPNEYELLNNESVGDLINYASGLTKKASSNIIIDQIIPPAQRASDDNAMSSMNIKLASSKSLKLNNGDMVNVLSIGDVSSKVEIFGRVKAPGKYSAINSTLLNILDMAGGFDDLLYKQTIIDPIIVLRKDINQFYSEEISVRYEDAGQFKLEIDDKIFVYEDTNYKHSFTYRVEGEVAHPGTYVLRSSNITIKEALELAGGLTVLGSEKNIIIKQEFTFINQDGKIINSSETISDATLDFNIGINSVIIATPLENVVRVKGNVYSPGLVTFKPGKRWPEYINLAGGYKPDTMKGNIYIQRANGKVARTSRFYFVGKKIYAGDTIIIPINPNPAEFDATAFFADLSSTLANIAAILLIVDNQN